ncbi:MAG: hypothetical protein MUC41_16330 [Syntrophobacteraceae bacterium]|jgi:hypothetical protein|nr:hypothetical protein [Syntrophobacteraceae bacterium]
MGYASGQGSHGFELLCVAKLRFQSVLCLRGQLTLGDVKDHSYHPDGLSLIVEQTAAEAGQPVHTAIRIDLKLKT